MAASQVLVKSCFSGFDQIERCLKIISLSDQVGIFFRLSVVQSILIHRVKVEGNVRRKMSLL